MTIVEIYHLEQGNTDCIYLYKEGLFWKAYEISAWLFTLLIRPYKINVRKYKAIDDPVVSLGFPETVLATLLDGHQVLNRISVTTRFGW